MNDTSLDALLYGDAGPPAPEVAAQYPADWPWPYTRPTDLATAVSLIYGSLAAAQIMAGPPYMHECAWWKTVHLKPKGLDMQGRRIVSHVEITTTPRLKFYPGRFNLE